MEKITKNCKCGARFSTAADTADECTSCCLSTTIKAAVSGRVYNCLHCTNGFQPNTVAQTFCSAICRRRHNAKHKEAIKTPINICPVCERTFERVTEGQRFCGFKYCTPANLVELNKERKRWAKESNIAIAETA